MDSGPWAQLLTACMDYARRQGHPFPESGVRGRVYLCPDPAHMQFTSSKAMEKPVSVSGHASQQTVQYDKTTPSATIRVQTQTPGPPLLHSPTGYALDMHWTRTPGTHKPQA